MHWKTFTRDRVWLIYQGHTNTSRIGREKRGQEAFFRLWSQYFYCLNVLARTGHLVRQLGGKHRSKLNSVGHDRRTDVIGIDWSTKPNRSFQARSSLKNWPIWPPKWGLWKNEDVAVVLLKWPSDRRIIFFVVVDTIFTEMSKTFSACQTFGLTNLENLPYRMKTSGPVQSQSSYNSIGLYCPDLAISIWPDRDMKVQNQ